MSSDAAASPSSRKPRSSETGPARLAGGEGPKQKVFALGYAGWGAGQLEREMQDNAWLSGPVEQSILFDLPADQRWEAAARLLGVDVNLLSSEAGHA